MSETVSAPAARPGPATAGMEGRYGFSITVPESWFEIELEPALRDDAARRLVEDRVRGNQAMWDARQGIIRLLREQARVAWESGAAYCACMAHPTEDGPITASVTVSLVRGPVGARADGDPAGAILDTLESRPVADDGSYASIAAPQLEGVGPVARSYGLEDVAIDGGAGYIRVVTMQTFVPVPEMNKVFVISCSSPVVALHEEMLDLFDAVSGTFRILDLAGDR